LIGTKNNYDFNLEENENYNSKNPMNDFDNNNNKLRDNENIFMEELQDVSIIQKDVNNNYSGFKRDSINISNFNLNQDDKEEGAKIENDNTYNDNNNKNNQNNFNKFKNMKNISKMVNRKSKQFLNFLFFINFFLIIFIF